MTSEPLQHIRVALASSSYARIVVPGTWWVLTPEPLQCLDMPLRQVLNEVDASSKIEWIQYNSWGMRDEEGEWEFTLGQERWDMLDRYFHILVSIVLQLNVS